jgi:hypothetical protein
MTEIKHLIEEWIEMRATLQRQLQMLESAEMRTGEVRYDDAPERLTKGLPRHSSAARLGVSVNCQGRALAEISCARLSSAHWPQLTSARWPCMPKINRRAIFISGLISRNHRPTHSTYSRTSKI